MPQSKSQILKVIRWKSSHQNQSPTPKLNEYGTIGTFPKVKAQTLKPSGKLQMTKIAEY